MGASFFFLKKDKMSEQRNLELIKSDFRNCLYAVWKCLNLPEPTKAQYEIAYYLQYGSSKRKIIEAFRGVGKSWITSVFVLWLLLNNPNLKILVVSASQQRASDFSTFCHRLMEEISFFRCLQPEDNQRNSTISFDVKGALPSHMPSVKSLGVFGQIVGSRADYIIADDVETNQNSITEDARDKLIRTVGDFNAILTPNERSSIIFLGTPQSEYSVYTHLRENASYECFIIPSEYPSLGDISKYNGCLAKYIEDEVRLNPSKVGQSTDPLRFTSLDLAERKASLGRSAYQLQFMLDTTLSDALKYPLKTSDLIILPIHPELAPISLAYGSSPDLQIRDIPNIGFQGDRFYRPFFMDKEYSPYEGSMMYIDPSGRGADELAYVIVNQLHGYLYLMKWGGFAGGYEDKTLESLARLAKTYSVKYIRVEPNFGDGMFTALLKPIMARIYPCTVEDDDHKTKQKELRIIDTLEPILNRHRLIVDEQSVREDLKLIEANPKYSLFYQLTHITRDRGSLKHDDRLDALEGAVNYWINSMSRDEVIAAQDFRDKALEKELNNFMEHCLGHKDQRDGWI